MDFLNTMTLVVIIVMVNMVSGPLSLARDNQLMVFRLAQAWPTPTIPATDSVQVSTNHSVRGPHLAPDWLRWARPARRGQPTGREKFVMREPALTETGMLRVGRAEDDCANRPRTSQTLSQ